MKKYLLAVVALLPTIAYAQQPQPNFVPYTITADEHQALLNYLGEQPAKFAMPIINSLTQWELAAQQKKPVVGTVETKPAEKKEPEKKK